VLREKGDLDGAQQELTAALEVARAELPDPHPSTVSLLVQLASVAREQGDLAAAERWMTESVEDGLELWGANHPVVREQQTRLDSVRHAREASYPR